MGKKKRAKQDKADAKLLEDALTSSTQVVGTVENFQLQGCGCYRPWNSILPQHCHNCCHCCCCHNSYHQPYTIQPYTTGGNTWPILGNGVVTYG